MEIIKGKEPTVEEHNNETVAALVDTIGDYIHAFCKKYDGSKIRKY